MSLYTPYLTIGELAQRTGVGVSTLRAWEQRHGFPMPQRLASGHRRYSAGDEEAVRRVVEARLAGQTLDAAIAHATRAGASPAHSLLAAMRQCRPDLTTRPMSRRAMLAISRAIEDEAAVRALGAVLIGAFQQPAALARVRTRWADLARAAHTTLAFATFARPTRQGAYWEVPVDERAPLAQEWAVVVDSASFAACLVGRELPGAPATRRSGRGAFEALWSVEPDVVREVARAATAAASTAPAAVDALRTRLGEPPRITHDVVRTMTTLTNRIIGEMDARTADRARF